MTHEFQIVFRNIDQTDALVVRLKKELISLNVIVIKSLLVVLCWIHPIITTTKERFIR